MSKVNLTEYIYPTMDVLFVALNAPVESNANKHWFSGSLSFWNLLHRSGLITKSISSPLEGDEIVFGSTEINHQNWVYGVTDLNRREVETDSSMVNVLDEDVIRILRILDRNSVKRVCLLHSKVGAAFRNTEIDMNLTDNRYGLIGKYNKTLIYEVPFHNASIANKERYYSQLITEEIPGTIENSNFQPMSDAIPSKYKQSFVLPARGNTITKHDISKGYIRITVDFKPYFPDHDSTMIIAYTSGEKSVKFVQRDWRSHLLMVGRELFQATGFNIGDRLEITVIEPERLYYIRKI